MGDVIISLVLACYSIAITAFYIIPKQIAEVARPHNQFTRLRWIILTLFVISVITSIPGFVYLLSLLFNDPSSLFLAVSRVLSNISRAINTTLLLMIYTYDYEDK